MMKMTPERRATLLQIATRKTTNVHERMAALDLLLDHQALDLAPPGSRHKALRAKVNMLQTRISRLERHIKLTRAARKSRATGPIRSVKLADRANEGLSEGTGILKRLLAEADSLSQPEIQALSDLIVCAMDGPWTNLMRLRLGAAIKLLCERERGE